jgi:hypothetical protein
MVYKRGYTCVESALLDLAISWDRGFNKEVCNICGKIFMSKDCKHYDDCICLLAEETIKWHHRGLDNGE